MTTEVDDLDKPIDEALLRGDVPKSESEEPKAEPETTEEAESTAEVASEVTEDTEARREDTIPKARFNEVNEERKALRAELERRDALERQTTEQHQEQQATTDIKALRREATQALLEGDTDKHDDLQDRIYAEILRQAEDRAETKVNQRSEAAVFQAKAAELTAAYPVLNPETGDPEAIALVVDLRDAYIAKGMSMSQALETAVKKIAPRFAAPVSAPEPVADTRKVTAIQRGAKDNNRIPPQGGGVGNRSITPEDNTAPPTQAQWDKMSKEQRDKALAAA